MMPAVLQPNAAVITNLRRKPVGDEDIASAKGHAAGTLYVTPDGNVLLLRRSPKEENFAGHWALPGGGVEDGESPEDGARREAMEEMGPDIPQGKRKLIDQKVTPTGMVFHTFGQPVDQMFTPRLNGEHTAYTWAPLNALPSPMHPAVQGTLNTRLGMASDMSPEDWEGMVGGLLKFLAEEAQEPEHAEDQVSLKRIKFSGPGADAHENRKEHDGKPVGDDAIALALDRESIKMKDVDGRLHVADVPLCRESVDEYLGSEIPGYRKLGLEAGKKYALWRPAEELQKALPSINGIPVLRKHVATSAADHKSKDTIGSTGTGARWDPPFIRGELVIWPAEDIELIENKEKFCLSPGYKYEPILEDGNFEGKPYSVKMVNIAFNHLACVEQGRQAEVAIDEAIDNAEWRLIERAIFSITACANVR